MFLTFQDMNNVSEFELISALYVFKIRSKH